MKPKDEEIYKIIKECLLLLLLLGLNSATEQHNISVSDGMYVMTVEYYVEFSLEDRWKESRSCWLAKAETHVK